MLGVLLAGAGFSTAFNADTGLIPFVPLQSFSVTGESSQPESGAISVADQSYGDTVVVESITVPPPGVWVAIREVNGVDLGNVLGALRVNGPRSAVSITLLRATEPHRAYAVELYRDDAGGAFDPAVNSVYVDLTTGVPAITRFTTTDSSRSNGARAD